MVPRRDGACDFVINDIKIDGCGQLRDPDGVVGSSMIPAEAFCTSSPFTFDPGSLFEITVTNISAAESTLALVIVQDQQSAEAGQ